LRPYHRNRILTAINPELDPLGSGYQVIQSKTALGSGGFLGKGWGEGTQTQLKFLPVQESDFIVSVIGEELGFISILIMLIYLILFKNKSFATDIIDISFNIISILTGTGYVTKDFDQWGNFPLIFFLILMFIGGCAGSTACGIKIFRIQLLYRFLSNQLKKIIYPRGIFVIKYDNNNIDDKFMSSVISFIFLYIIIFFCLAAILSLTGLDFVTSISGAATSISNVGPGLGDIIGPNGNFSSLSHPSKWALSMGMILGRLELFAILVLFIPSFWRKF